MYLYETEFVEDVVTEKFDRNNFGVAETEDLLVDVFGKSEEFENVLRKQYKLINVKR